jgi:hypothetical protein
MIQRIKTIYRTHYNFVPLLILAVFFRLMVIFLFRPGGFITYWAEYSNWLGIARVSDYGLYPYINYWLEYPPLFPWLFIAVYRLSLIIPVWWWADQLWFNVLLGLTILPFEIGNLVMVYLLASELYDRVTAMKCSWFYACLFVPVYSIIGFFDSLPLFFMLLTLYLLLKQRELLAGMALGIGFMIKVMPLIFLPVGLRALRGLSRKANYLISSGATIVLLSLPFLWLGSDFFWAFFRGVLQRSSWETIWAVLEGYYHFGVVGGDRLDPLADVSVHPSTLPWFWITLAFALIGLWIYTWPLADRFRVFREFRDSAFKLRVVILAALTLNLFTLYSKGWGPQFLIYILPFVLILLPNLRGVVYCILLSIVNFIEYPVYFVLLLGEDYTTPTEHWLLVLVVVLRAILLLALCLEYGFVFFSLASTRMARLWRRVYVYSLIALLLGGCAISYPIAQAYYHNRYAQDELHAAMGFLRTQVSKENTGLIFTDQSLYHRFYPFLRKDLSLYLVEGVGEDAGERLNKDADARLAEIAARQDETWLLRGPEAQPSVEEWLNKERYPIASYRFRDIRLIRYSTAQGTDSPPFLADLDGKIRLLSYHLDNTQVKAGREIHLALYWQALQKMDRSYTVFTHVLGEDNRTWGQKDNPPVSGTFLTSEWQEGEVVEDSYIIPIRADIPQGTYRIEVGLYDPQTMQRLQVLDKQGSPQGNRIILPEEIYVN